jgi:hypothetical protein
MGPAYLNNQSDFGRVLGEALALAAKIGVKHICAETQHEQSNV